MIDTYDYERYEEILIAMLETMLRDPNYLEIGENISDIPEVKIIFDGYGYNEETDEQDDINMESYAVFIHKDALKRNFEFPEHEFTPWGLIHRPTEEVCIYVWYDVEKDEWDIIPLEDRIDDDTVMTVKDVMIVLEGLYKKYFESEEDEIVTH